MRKETKEILKLTSREILLAIADTALAIGSGFAKDHKTKFEIRRYLDYRSCDKADFARKIYRLKQLGMINKFVEGKTKYLEITTKGLKHIQDHQLENLKIPKLTPWDGRWRVVIFDIPEKKRDVRDFLRYHLYDIGFEQIQKSVFVYPFECTTEINLICNQSGGREYLKFMISEIIEGEADIIRSFLDKGIIDKTDLVERK